MRRSSLLWGALLVAVTSIPLMAIMFLAHRLADVPFVPFDLFDWIARALPGSVLSRLIDAMVRVIRVLRLGDTSHAAKLIEQVIAISTMVVLCVLFGAVVGYMLARKTWSAARIGLAGGFVLFLFIIGVEVFRGFPANPWLSVPWLALLTIGWGLLLAIWVGGVVRQTERPADDEAYRATRRALLRKIAAGSVAVALAAWGLGWVLQQRRLQTGAAQPLSQATPTPPVGSDQRIEVAPGTRPEVTANDDFYSIEIDLEAPTLSQSSWKLNVKGLFDNPRSLSLADLMAYPAVTQPVTLSCISNPIGGPLIGNAYWTGVRLVDVLKDLGLRPEAKELSIKAADGFYESVTMDDLRDQHTLLVYGMNGETLPIEHGFPLRILIPNHYGMKQPKWITSIEAIDRSGSGYWVDRIWSREARPQVVSMIDVIAKDRIVGGRIPIGGIAWAGDRGIQKVEIQVDDGPWEAATLRVPALGPLTWVQWRYDWPRVAGRHTFRLRATDGAGTDQAAWPSDPYPDGATGYHILSKTF